MTANLATEVASTPTAKAECRSMNGYALVQGNFEGWLIRVTLKSVNHRFLDVKTRIPDSLELYEHQLRQVVRGRIHRGHVDVHISIEPSEAVPVHLNRELVKAYVTAAEELRKLMGGKTEIDTVALLRLPGVITVLALPVPESQEGQEELGKVLKTCVEEALGKMDEMRRTEGRRLADKLHARAGKIIRETEQVRELARTLRPAYSRRLEARLRNLLKGSNIEPARLAQESAILSERGDISEELDRLQSHLKQLAKLTDEGGELGKKIDFLLQEIHREVNTMLSKMPSLEGDSLTMTGLALEIKTDVEKLREQAQDIE